MGDVDSESNVIVLLLYLSTLAMKRALNSGVGIRGERYWEMKSRTGWDMLTSLASSTCKEASTVETLCGKR